MGCWLRKEHSGARQPPSAASVSMLVFLAAFRFDFGGFAEVQRGSGRQLFDPRYPEHWRALVSNLEGEFYLVASPDVIVMHPGPLNRGVEISSEVADGPRSVILEQVTNGVAVRMAALLLLIGGEKA